MFSAEIGRHFGPCSETPVVLMRDVIICTTGDADADVDEFQKYPPVGSPLMRRLEGSADPVEFGVGFDLIDSQMTRPNS